jgi:hypothetical protein
LYWQPVVTFDQTAGLVVKRRSGVNVSLEIQSCIERVAPDTSWRFSFSPDGMDEPKGATI